MFNFFKKKPTVALSIDLESEEYVVDNKTTGEVVRYKHKDYRIISHGSELIIGKIDHQEKSLNEFCTINCKPVEVPSREGFYNLRNKGFIMSDDQFDLICSKIEQMDGLVEMTKTIDRCSATILSNEAGVYNLVSSHHHLVGLVMTVMFNEHGSDEQVEIKPPYGNNLTKYVKNVVKKIEVDKVDQHNQLAEKALASLN